MFEWLVENVAFFKLHHNVHREFGMTVQEHLDHRRRIGHPAVASGPEAMKLCQQRDELWELLAVLPCGLSIEAAGPDLSDCIRAVRLEASRHGGEGSLAAA
jgi:hypothetical protein